MIRPDNVVLDHIRAYRNDLIKAYLIDEFLLEYFQLNHHWNVSGRRLQFIKRSLQQLLSAPVDLQHYAKLILDLRAEQQTRAVLLKHHALFLTEIGEALKSYIY